MKKNYFLVVVMSLLISGKSMAQFYDGFTGTGNIGGDCTTTDCNSNGWFTHSGTLAGTIEILTDGSLSYSGLSASTGNRILLPASNSTTSRDINAAVVNITGSVAYFSALINVVDATQLSASSFDYFMHLAPQSGNTFSVFTYTGRLGAKSVNSATNFRLGIENIGTSFTEYDTDLSFGVTYLVVVKVDGSTTPNITASLWVNPLSLGGDEPTTTITNSAGSSTNSSYGSICLRNGSGTPKVEIDEIRVGTTWASVTPAASTTEVSNGVKSNVKNVFTSDNNLIIDITNSNVSNAKADVYDLVGKKVATYTLQNGTNSFATEAKGIVFVKISVNNEAVTRKVYLQ